MQKTIIFTLILYFASFCSLAGNVALPNNLRYIVIASRPTLEEAISIARLYRQTFKYTDIFSSSNGWYAITIGTIDYPTDEFRLEQYISEGKVPSDSYFSQGNNFNEVYDSIEIDRILTTNSQENQETVIADEKNQTEITKSSTSPYPEQQSDLSNNTTRLIAIGALIALGVAIFGGSSSTESTDSPELRYYKEPQPMRSNEPQTEQRPLEYQTPFVPGGPGQFDYR